VPRALMAFVKIVLQSEYMKQCGRQRSHETRISERKKASHVKTYLPHANEAYHPGILNWLMRYTRSSADQNMSKTLYQSRPISFAKPGDIGTPSMHITTDKPTRLGLLLCSLLRNDICLVDHSLYYNLLIRRKVRGKRLVKLRLFSLQF